MASKKVSGKLGAKRFLLAAWRHAGENGNMQVEKLVVVGPGLLGASVLQAARALGVARSTGAWARRAETRVACRDQAWCDEVYDSPDAAASAADLLVFCIPVEHIIPQFEAMAPLIRPDTLVTDVGSTKSLICRSARAIPCAGTFIGSHPMAGSEKTGFAHARSDLFDRRACFVTPLDDTPSGELECLIRFWRALGMEVATATPEDHDEIVAHVSHLPHLLASALTSYLSGQPDSWRTLAGSGLRDSTRIAAGDPHLWKAIFQQNKFEVLRALAGFEAELQEFRAALHNEDWFALIRLLKSGKQYRDDLNE